MFTRTFTALSALLILGACSALTDSFSLADGSTHDDDISLVNGLIDIGADCRVDGEVGNVNGVIQVGNNSRVRDIDNVNGRISLGNGVEVDGDISSVNGRVDLGADARVSGDVESVNGLISAASGVVIGGQVSSVNGPIEMHGARAAGLATNNSRIRLDAGTVIAGELTVRKSQGFNFSASSPPKVVIGRNVTVEGPLNFEREVELYVHESASVGEISGAQAVTYSGDEP